MLAQPLVILALATQILAVAPPALAADLGKAKTDLRAFSQSAEYRRLAQLGDRAAAELKAATARHPELEYTLSPQGLGSLTTQRGQQAIVRPIVEKAMPLLQAGLGPRYPGFVRGVTRLGDAYLRQEPGALIRETWYLTWEEFESTNP